MRHGGTEDINVMQKCTKIDTKVYSKILFVKSPGNLTALNGLVSIFVHETINDHPMNIYALYL